MFVVAASGVLSWNTGFDTASWLQCLPWESYVCSALFAAAERVLKQHATGAGDDSDSEEELSAAEELRRAASAYAAVSKAPKAPSPDVIVISDSSDDERPAPPPARRPLPTSVQPNPSILRPAQQVSMHQCSPVWWDAVWLLTCAWSGVLHDLYAVLTCLALPVAGPES